MSSSSRPFSQQDKLATLDIATCLSPVESKVLWLLGAFAGDAIGASVKTICQYAKLSRPSVSTALDRLCVLEYALCFEDEDNIRHYWPSEKLYRCPANEPVSVLELVPVSGITQRESRATTHVKKIFTSSPVVGVNSKNLNSGFEHQHQTCPETIAILKAAGVNPGPQFNWLAEHVDPERARRWFVEWVKHPPEWSRNPVGYAINRLTEDPESDPPAAKTWYGPEYAKYVKR